MSESDHSRFWIAAEVSLGLTLVLLPMALGGAPEWTSWLLWALASSACILWAMGAARNRRRWGWHPVLLVPGLVALVGLFQLVPLPPAVLAAISGSNAELRIFALVPLGLEGWRPLAVDAPAAAKGLARVLSLGMLLLVSLELGRLPGVRRRLLSVLALSGTATALCGFVHLLGEFDSLLGVVRFTGNVPLLTPFGNTNHLAAWLLLTGTIAAGLALNSPTRDEAIGWGLAALACGVGVFLSFSRGGIGSFVATWALLGATLLARRGGGLRSVIPWVLIGATMLMAGLLSFEQLVDRADSLATLEKFKATKLSLWPMFAQGLAPFWILGMGLGGFELGFAPKQTSDLTVIFTHPEALPLQWVSDVGLPLTLLVAGFSVWLFLRLWRSLATHETERFALVGLVGLGLHDVFDFALELNAVAAAGTIVIGLLCAVDVVGSRAAVQRRGLFLVTLPAGVAAIALAFALPGYASAERRLNKAIEERRPFAEVRALAIRLIDRHPADWVLYSNFAQYAAAQADPRESLAWINRVLALRPLDAASHVSAARALYRMNRPGQALGELKLAWERGDSGSLEWGLDLAAKRSAWERVLLPRVGHLDQAYWSLRSRGRVVDARALLEAAMVSPPSDEVLEEASLLAVRHEADLGSPERALGELDALPVELRQRADLVLTRVQALSKLRRQSEAAGELERLLTREPSNLTASFTLVDILSSLGRVADARAVLQRAKPFVSNSAGRSLIFQKEAETWLQEERFPRALEALQTAARVEPRRPDLHYRLAEVYERMGSLHSALDEVRRGRMLDTPEGAKSRDAWVDRLEGSVGQLP